MRRLVHHSPGRRDEGGSLLCGLARYNGGLFNPDLHPKLESWRIGDASLANVLRQLIFAQPPTRPGPRQGQLSTDEAIDYSTLEVRQLGDIYEGLLGAHFVHERAMDTRNKIADIHERRHAAHTALLWVRGFRTFLLSLV